MTGRKPRPCFYRNLKKKANPILPQASGLEELSHGQSSGSEERYFKILFENAPLAYQSLDEDGNIIDVNQAWLETLGYTRDEVLGRCAGEFLVPEEVSLFQSRFPMFKKVGEIRDARFHLVRKDGQVLLASFDGKIGRNPDHSFRQTHCIFHNVTDLQKIENALRDSEEKYRMLVENSLQATLIFQEDRIVFANPAAARIFGYTPTELTRFDLEQIKLSTHPDDWELVKQRAEQTLEQGTAQQVFEIRFINRDGSPRWVEITMCHVSYLGQPAILANYMDVNDRKLAEEQLFKDREKYRDFIEGTEDLVIQVDADGTIRFTNHAAEKIFGLPAEECVGQPILNFIHPDDRGAAGVPHLGLKPQQKVRAFSFEERLISDKGQVFDILWSATDHFDAHGSFLFRNAIGQNITARKLASLSLKEAKERLEATLNALPDLLFEVDRDGRIFDFRAPHPDMLFTSPDRFMGRDLDEFLPPEAVKVIKNAITAAAQTGICAGAIYPLPNEMSGNLWFELSAAAKGDLNSKDLRIIALVRDITARMESEQALRESEERYHRIIDTAFEGIWMTDDQFITRFVNARTAEMLGYQPEELVGQSILNFLYEEDRPDVDQQIAFRKNGVSGRYERRFKRKDGRTVWSLMSVMPVFDEKKHFSGSFAMLADITNLKETDQALRGSLREKELLLKEIHHRVKNNMQVIISLINLQADSIQDEQALSALRDTQNRVMAMAYVHEQLYQSQDMSSVDFGTYLQTLTRQMFRSYGVANETMSLHLDINSIALDIYHAIPCALIVNELISNSLKHGFPGSRPGNLYVSLSSSGGMITIQVRDDGIGIPASVDVHNTSSLGLQLVHILTQQIQGQLNLDRENGTSFTITFPASRS